MKGAEWKCPGCGVKTLNKVRGCDCATEVVMRGRETEFKINPCKNHKDIPMRENLDGDNLCLGCCEVWVNSEKERVSV